MKLSGLQASTAGAVERSAPGSCSVLSVSAEASSDRSGVWTVLVSVAAASSAREPEWEGGNTGKTNVKKATTASTRRRFLEGSIPS